MCPYIEGLMYYTKIQLGNWEVEQDVVQLLITH